MHLPSALLVTAAAAMVFEPAENDNIPAVQGIGEEAAAAFAAPINDDDDVVDFQKRQAAKQGSGGNKNGVKKGNSSKKGNAGNKKKGGQNNKQGKGKGKKGKGKGKGEEGKGKGKGEGKGKGKGKGEGKNGKAATGKPTEPDTPTELKVEGVSDTSDIGLFLSEKPTIVGSSFPSEFTINVGTDKWIAKKDGSPQIAVLSKRSVNQKNEGFVANPFAALATLLMGGLMFLL